MLGVDHDKIILLSTPFPTNPMLGKNGWCDVQVIVFYVGNKRCCIVLYCIVLYCTVLYCTALHCTALHCTALHCTALHCTALRCAALRCAALRCVASRRMASLRIASYCIVGECAQDDHWAQYRHPTFLRNWRAK